MKHKKRNTGFTLIELSIVLVIISLIVGGVIGGKVLIRSSELRNIISDLYSYDTAINTFNLQYDALPGDFREAASYWPACLDDDTNTCNGNGNSVYTLKAGKSENIRAWQHLGLSKILSDDFVGINTGIREEMYPETSMGILIDVSSFGYSESAINQSIYGKSGNALVFYGLQEVENNVFINIDKKADDGIADTGRIYGVSFDASTPCTTGHYSGASGDWLKTGNSVLCSLIYWLN